MNIEVRLSDGNTDSFRDHNPQANRGITRHKYEVRDDESLAIVKRLFTCRTYQVIDGSVRYIDMYDDGATEVAYYRPFQWTSVREV